MTQRSLPVASLLGAIVAASFLARLVILTRVHGPWIFPDELGYEQVAANIARGRLALYSERGLSYSPLYPLLLAPPFGFGLSAPTAYGWIKAINALLMSLSLLPVYGLARFMLPRRAALGVVVLAAVAPLMYYTALGMSENLAYPLVVLATWLLLRTLAAPTPRNDALFLIAALAATATRVQLVVLLPAALTALLLAAAVQPGRRLGRPTHVRAAVNAHRTLVLGIVVLAVAATLPAAFGHSAFSAAGRYSNVPQSHPSLVKIAKLFVYHAGELVFAAGVIPFVAAVAAAWILISRGAGERAIAFAATGVALTFWLLLETAVATESFERQGDAPRIHERYLFYVVPLFLTAMLVAARDGRVRRSRIAVPLGITAAGLGALAIPYQTVVNGTIVADTFSLQFVARNDTLQAIGHASLAALCVAVGLGLVYFALRSQVAVLIVLMIAVFVYGSQRLGARIDRASNGAHAFFTSSRFDWVDRAHPRGGVALVAGPALTGPVAEWHTAYYNLSIDRLYFACRRTLSPDFGERRLSVARSGTVLTAGRPLRVAYAVVPTGLGIEGTVHARDRVAGVELVETQSGVLRVDSAHHARWRCAPSDA